MHVIIAQGGGFYGSAFFTTDLSFEKLKMGLEEESGFNIHKQGDDDIITLHYPPDTGIQIRSWNGKPQPWPVVLFDSGHATIDHHLLGHLYSILKRPYMTNGNMEKKHAAKRIRAVPQDKGETT